MSEFEDKLLTCADCGNTFTWEAGEQEYFAEKGFTELPERCNECRRARKVWDGGAAKKGGKK